MVDYFGIMELISSEDWLSIALLPYLHQYGKMFWVAMWAMLMLVIYIKVGDLMVVIALTTIMFGSVAVYSTAYDFFPVQIIAFALVILCIVTAGILYAYYSRMR
jgi:hypothetical protein